MHPSAASLQERSTYICYMERRNLNMERRNLIQQMMSGCKCSLTNISCSATKEQKQENFKIKKLYANSWPPYSRVLVQKTKRTMFVTRQWTCSYMHFQPTSGPSEYGSRLENNEY